MIVHYDLAFKRFELIDLNSDGSVSLEEFIKSHELQGKKIFVHTVILNHFRNRFKRNFKN